MYRKIVVLPAIEERDTERLENNLKYDSVPLLWKANLVIYQLEKHINTKGSNCTLQVSTLWK